MKRLFLISVLSLTVYLLQGQYRPATIDDYKQFKNTKTMVVYEGTLMSEYDARMKEIMARSWTITPYDFVTQREFDEKLKNDPSLSFLMLNVINFEGDKNKARYKFLSLVIGQKDNKKLQTLPDLCSLPLSYERVEDASYLYKLEAFVNFIQNHINTVIANPKLAGEKGLTKYGKKISGSLSSKTLYVLQNELSPDINTIDKIQKVYKFPVKIVTQEDIATAIANKDENVVFLHKVGPENTKSIGTRVWKLIVGAADSKLYYFNYDTVDQASDDALQKSDLKKMK